MILRIGSFVLNDSHLCSSLDSSSFVVISSCVSTPKFLFMLGGGSSLYYNETVILLVCSIVFIPKLDAFLDAMLCLVDYPKKVNTTSSLGLQSFSCLSPKIWALIYDEHSTNF